MKILVLTPYLQPLVRGNAVTVSRIAESLTERSCLVSAVAVLPSVPADVAARIVADPPDLVHAFHAYDAGLEGLAISRKSRCPMVTTITGSDLFESLRNGKRAATVEVLRASTAVTVFHHGIRRELLTEVPDLAVPVEVIPQAVDANAALRQAPSNEVPVLLLPAGLRPVKNVIGCIAALEPLYRQGERFRLLIAGPVLDPEYGAQVVEAAEKAPFATYLGEVDHTAMAGLYAEADVVLNTSLFEGGMANSLLEAMAAARPVVASDVAGNRTIVTDGENGFLYADEDDFRRKIICLLHDPTLRRTLGGQGRLLVSSRFSIQQEAEAYLRLYSSILKTGI